MTNIKKPKIISDLKLDLNNIEKDIEDYLEAKYMAGKLPSVPTRDLDLKLLDNRLRRLKNSSVAGKRKASKKSKQKAKQKKAISN